MNHLNRYLDNESYEYQHQHHTVKQSNFFKMISLSRNRSTNLFSFRYLLLMRGFIPCEGHLNIHSVLYISCKMVFEM